MDSSADVTLVIPQYNHLELTSACIQSIRVNESNLWPIVVVDDGSTQRSRPLFESRNYSGTRLVEQKHSGVSSAWNRGVAAADSSFLVFLNNDVLFSGSVIERLVGPLRNGEALITGIAMRKETALSQSILKDLPTDRFLEGWCFATATETFHSLGGFDESMTVYWSDTDFQCRLVRKFGRDRNVCSCVSGLPLNHLRHRTVHSMQQHRTVWLKDRSSFIAKWIHGANSEQTGGVQEFLNL